VLRHAHAEQAWVRIVGSDNGQVEVCIDDDGVGLKPSQAAAQFHYGLAIMRERAQGLRGDLSLTDRPGGGTRIILRFQADTLPLPI
jgi:two-component system nitrate/nitrite sensor histidine kinase NarX